MAHRLAKRLIIKNGPAISQFFIFPKTIFNFPTHVETKLYTLYMVKELMITPWSISSCLKSDWYFSFDNSSIEYASTE